MRLYSPYITEATARFEISSSDVMTFGPCGSEIFLKDYITAARHDS